MSFIAVVVDRGAIPSVQYFFVPLEPARHLLAPVLVVNKKGNNHRGIFVYHPHFLC